MKIRTIKTIGGKWQIVDADDDGAPLLSFHNEFNKEGVVEGIFNYLTQEGSQEPHSED